MAIEDFTPPNYDETDADNDLTVTATKIDITSLRRDVSSFVNNDFGEDHFTGSYTHIGEYYHDSVSDNASLIVIHCLSNVTGDLTQIFAADLPFLQVTLFDGAVSTVARVNLIERDLGGEGTFQDSVDLSFDTLYYYKFKMDEDVGEFGTMYFFIYDDSDRTNLVGSLNIAIHTSKKNYSIYSPFISLGEAVGAEEFTGYIQNVDLQEAITVVQKIAGIFGIGRLGLR